MIAVPLDRVSEAATRPQCFEKSTWGSPGTGEPHVDLHNQWNVMSAVPGVVVGQTKMLPEVLVAVKVPV